MACKKHVDVMNNYYLAFFHLKIEHSFKFPFGKFKFWTTVKSIGLFKHAYLIVLCLAEHNLTDKLEYRNVYWEESENMESSQ